jgi:hypothetical protein
LASSSLAAVFSHHISDDRHLFEQVRPKPDSRTIEWPGEVDLDPDVLYGTHEPASGIRIARRVVHAPTHARL